MTTNDNLKHHIKHNYCRTRPTYRAGKKLTAVKAYCVIDESKHLMVFGVPKINLATEVRTKFLKFGKLLRFECVTDRMAREMELERFTDCFYIVYNELKHARKAKQNLDARNFYGGVLHISYASERETIEELQQKLVQRRFEVELRLRIAKKCNYDDVESNDEIINLPPSKQLKKSG